MLKQSLAVLILSFISFQTWAESDDMKSYLGLNLTDSSQLTRCKADGDLPTKSQSLAEEAYMVISQVLEGATSIKSQSAQTGDQNKQLMTLTSKNEKLTLRYDIEKETYDQISIDFLSSDNKNYSSSITCKLEE